MAEQKFIGVVVSEGEVDECFEFASADELKGFAKGASHAASIYGGSAYVFHNEDLPDDDDGQELQDAVRLALAYAENGKGISRA